MSEQSQAYEAWLDHVVKTGRVDAGEFARHAIGELPKIEATVRYPTRRDVWPKEVREEMGKIARGEIE